jgi:general secretion pathway protein I
MRGRPARQAGFTLIEVLVALAILSLAVVASIQGFAQGLRLLKLAGDHQLAMLVADEKVREVVEPKEGRDEGTEGALRWERTTRALETPDLMPAGVLPRGKVYEIDVRVSWDASRHVEIRTLRMVPTLAAQPGVPGAIPRGGEGGTTPGSSSQMGPLGTGGTSPQTRPTGNPFGRSGAK